MRLIRRMPCRRTSRLLALLALAAAPLRAHAQLASAALLAAAPAAAAGDSSLAPVIDSIVRRAMADQSIPGLSLAIVKDGRVLVERGYGRGDARRELPATASTVYQIASITKQFTAAAVLRLAEQGRLGLGDPVTDYVGGLPSEYRAVTLERLLNHTAGVPNFTEFFRDFRKPLSPGQVVDSLAARPLLFEPGQGFHYSNSGYYLLGLVIERVTGQSFGGYLKEEFWQPLGMGDTEYCGLRAGMPLPTGYLRDRRGDAVRALPWDPSVLYAAGSICSTAADLARWEVALGEGRVLSPASYQRMTTPAGTADRDVRMTYGFAMMVDTTDAGPYLHHDGAVSGFRAQVAWYPDERLAVVVLMNQGLAAPEPVERDLARAVLGRASLPQQAVRASSSRTRASGAAPTPWDGGP